jgi:aldehyde dehydrogenase (NAD+)
MLIYQVLPGLVFGAVGTAGQRCTSTRRLIIHEDIYEDVKQKLVNAYKQLKLESIKRKKSRWSIN